MKIVGVFLRASVLACFCAEDAAGFAPLASICGFENAGRVATIAPHSTSSSGSSSSSRPTGHAATRSITTALAVSEEDEGTDDSSVLSSLFLTESDQTILGAAGTLASLVVFYSEFTLRTTGCGLPAGPLGIVGLVEGLSYLGITGIAAYSTVAKVKTGSGLPAGPGGLLGAAEGLSFLAIAVGLVVLGLQISSYGYIPNAVPMEGGMCS